jgi:hypothetical protein
VRPRAQRSAKVCVICGAPRFIERNHPGGQNHIAWFTMPFCKFHHDQFHEQLRNIGIDLRYTPNELERLNRASQAIIVCQWMISEAMKRAISKNPQE